MSTNANVKKSDGSHWYYPDGKPCYELPKKDGTGMKVPTLADARKLNLVPGVTTILKILHKQALVEWMVEQAVLAVLTTPRQPGEPDDAFVKRVLSTDRVQDQESQAARDRGTEIHDAMEALMTCKPVSEEIKPWVMPAFDALRNRGTVIQTEMSIVGEGYGGRIDLILAADKVIEVWDYKSAKKLPDPEKGGAWSEHRLQLAAYAKAVRSQMLAAQKGLNVPEIRTANLYISTVECGKFVICEHEEWAGTYTAGFEPLVAHWQWANRYRPVAANAN